MRVNYSTNSGASPSWWMGATYIHPSMCKSVLLVLRTEKIDIPSTSFCSPCWKQTVDHPPQQKQFQQPRKNPIPRTQIISCHCCGQQQGWIELGRGLGLAKEGMRKGVEKSGYRNGKYYIYIGICLSYMSYVCTYIRRPSEACRYFHPTDHHHLAPKARQHNILL